MTNLYSKRTPTESICAEADRLVGGERGENYGHPYDDYRRTVEAFNALTGRGLTPQEGVLFMICVKLSREVHKHKRDNLVDVAGYAQCLEKVNDRIFRSNRVA